jgi:hypothetical protein
LNFVATVMALSVGVFLGVLACLEIGYRLGRREADRYPGSSHEGIGAIEAAVFGFLALLLAFSFAGATSRLDTRRQQIVDEANAIGTAYLRLDLLPSAQQPEARRLFRDYLDARLSVFEQVADPMVFEQQLLRANGLQQSIWSHAIAATRDDPSGGAARLLLPALNEMIDITTARTIAMNTHMPPMIFWFLIGVTLLSGIVAGYAVAKHRHRSFLHTTLYAGIVAVTVYVVFDLEHPRAGWIRLDAADKAMTDLRDAIR